MAADDPHNGHVPGPPYLTTEELRRDVSALREILQARLDGMDRATVVLSETVNRTPTAIQTAISNLRELMDQKLSAQSTTAIEKFRSIELQFAERDVRTNQAAIAADSALKAALQAAKEAVFEQAQAAAKAADKTELSFTKQIDLLLAQIKALGETFGDRLAELKERIDRGEGQSNGLSDSAISLRASATYTQTADLAKAATTSRNVSVAIASLGLLVSIIVVVLLISSGKG